MTKQLFTLHLKYYRILYDMYNLFIFSVLITDTEKKKHKTEHFIYLNKKYIVGGLRRGEASITRNKSLLHKLL